MPTIELDRSPIKLPRLADDEGVALPQPLTDAHKALLATATSAATKASEIAKDARWSEGERQRLLSELCDSTLKEIAPMGEVANAIDALAAESEANALRRAIGEFDGARLLMIADAIARRPREGRLSAVIRARNGDRESAAAILSAPVELGVLLDLDPRIVDGLRDVLIDPKLRQTCAATAFACARFRAGLSGATDTLRSLTRTAAPMRSRIARVA